jgi:hypothetical protein
MQKTVILSKINAIYGFIFTDAKILFNDVFAICLKSELRDYGLLRQNDAGREWQQRFIATEPLAG